MVHVFTSRKNNFIEEIYMTERESGGESTSCAVEI